MPNQMFIYSKHYPLIILIRKQQVAELLGNKESRKKKIKLGNESKLHNSQSKLLPPRYRFRKNCIHHAFAAQVHPQGRGFLFFRSLFGSSEGTGEGREETDLNRRWRFWSRFCSVKKMTENQGKIIKLRQDDAQPTHYLIVNLAVIVCQYKNLL